MIFARMWRRPRPSLSPKCVRCGPTSLPILTVNAKIDATRKELSDQIMGLRRAVVDYHSVVIGHGVLISEPEARLRRVEQHLNLAAGDAH